MTTTRIQLTMRRQAQRGIGLVEIMVALIIGLIMLGALSYFLLSGRIMNRTHDDLSRMQESGRHAMEAIGRAIRQTGYRLDINKTFDGAATSPASPIQGTDGGGSGASAPSDTITLRHDPAWIKDATNPPNPLKGREVNCAGNMIESDNDVDGATRKTNSKLVVYTFSVSNGQLRCATVNQNGGATSAIIADLVENLQIEYGLDPTGTGVITSYVTAGGVTDYSQVAAVRVSLLVKGPSANIAANRSQTYFYNNESKTSSDGFLRHVYSATFMPRNLTR